MAKLTEHQGANYVKGLVVGDPGTGKTGGLVSLVRAGYKVRIWDFDNLLTPLIQYIKKECPERADQVRFQTFTDKLKGPDTPAIMLAGNLVVPSPVEGQAKAYTNALKQLNHWNDGEDLGIPANWGKDTFVVIDTLTSMAKAAYRYGDGMNPAAKDKRAIFYVAQQLVSNALNLLASNSFNTNVLVLAHLDYETDQMGITKGFPRSIGSAIKTEIAAGFNCVLLTETQGNGPSARKVIRTNSTGVVDLKNPVSFKVPDTLPIETGYADFVKAVLT